MYVPYILHRNIYIAVQNYKYFEPLATLSSDMMLHRHKLLMIICRRRMAELLCHCYEIPRP